MGLTQLFDVARRLAEKGNQAARTALYQRFELGSTPEYAYLGDYDLVQLDGLAGLLRVATVRGQMLAHDPTEWEDDALLQFAQEGSPDVAVEAELEKAATTNPSVAHYLRAVRENQQAIRQRPPRPKIMALESVRQVLADPKGRRIPPQFIRRLTNRQVQLLAADFEQETNRARQAKYLQIYRRRKHPLGYERLLHLAETAPRFFSQRMLEDTVKALHFFRAPAIREFTLSRLADSPVASLYTHLLVNNYQVGDDQLLLRLVERTTGEAAVESLAIALCAIYQKNRTKKCREPLHAIYQRMNCGIHRAGVVELLLKRGVLSADIREEIPFDSYEGVRELMLELPA